MLPNVLFRNDRRMAMKKSNSDGDSDSTYNVYSVFTDT